MTVVVALLGGCTLLSPGAVGKREAATLCAGLCEHLEACGAHEDFPGARECTATCTRDPRQTTEPCQAPFVAYERCVIALSCEDVRAAVGLDPTSTSCLREREAVLACEPGPDLMPTIEFQF